MRASEANPITLLVIAVTLLLVGIVVDQAFTQPQVRELSRASVQRAALLDDVRELGLQHVQSDELAALFNLDDVSKVLDAPSLEPVAYVGQLIDRTKLKRVALTHAGTTQAGKLTRTKFTLQLTGSFPRIVAFIRALEQGPRLATVDAWTLDSLVGSSTLEAKLTLSIYDPAPR